MPAEKPPVPVPAPKVDNSPAVINEALRIETAPDPLYTIPSKGTLKRLNAHKAKTKPAPPASLHVPVNSAAVSPPAIAAAAPTPPPVLPGALPPHSVGDLCSDLSILAKRSESVSQKDFIPFFGEALDCYTDLEQKRSGDGLSPKEESCYAQLDQTLADLQLRAPPEMRSKALFHQQLGEYFLLKQKLREAKKSFSAAVDLDTTSIVPNYRLSQMAQQDDDLELEARHLKRALTEVPQNELASEAQNEAFRRYLNFFDPDPAEGLKLVEKWKKLSVSTKEVFVVEAKLLWRLKDAEALAKLLPVLEEPAKSLYSGYLSLLRKEGAQAVAHFSAHLKNPARDKTQDGPLLKILAKALLEAPSPKNARAVAEKGLVMSPRDRDFKTLHEQAISAGGFDAKNAVTDLQDAADLNPESLAIQLKILEFILKGVPKSNADADPEQLKAAEPHLERILTKDPGNLDASFWKGVLLYHRKSFSAADALFVEVLDRVRKGDKPQLNVRVADVFIVAANLKKSRGYFDEAKDLLQEGLALVGDQRQKAEIRRELSQ